MSKETTASILTLVSAILIIAVMFVLHPWIVMHLWNWHVVTIAPVEKLSWSDAFGLSVLISMWNLRSVATNDKVRNLGWVFGAGVMGPLFLLFLGWLAA